MIKIYIQYHTTQRLAEYKLFITIWNNYLDEDKQTLPCFMPWIHNWVYKNWKKRIIQQKEVHSIQNNRWWSVSMRTICHLWQPKNALRKLCKNIIRLNLYPIVVNVLLWSWWLEVMKSYFQNTGWLLAAGCWLQKGLRQTDLSFITSNHKHRNKLNCKKN